MANIEQLKKKTDEIKKWLEELKNNVSISESEKKDKAEKLKTQAEATKKKIQDEIDALKNETDEKSKKKMEEAEALLEKYDETMELYASVLNSQDAKKSDTQQDIQDESNDKAEDEPQDDEEKGIFTKTKEWVWEQWDDVWDKEKWETEWWKNLLRTAWFVATWVWAVALAYKWVKKLWNWAFWDKEEKEDEEETETKSKKKKKKKEGSSRWKKFLVWAWITVWTVVGWVQVYKHWNSISSRFKEKLWMALPFDEARQKVEAEVRNWKIDDDHFWAFNAHFDWITYDENTKELCSYGQKTKIDKTSKKLDDLPVEFASWEEMIHAANIVNFAKRMLRWRWASSQPFGLTDWWWDIGFTCSATWKQELIGMDGSTEREWILGTLWTVWWGILWSYCAWVHWAAIWAVWWWAWWYALWAYIDNSSAAWRCCWTIARWKNLDLFITYLNRQKDEDWKSLRESWWEQHIDPNDTPVNEVVDNWKEWSEWGWVLAEIENSYWEDQTKRRRLTIERNESNPKEYTIGSYGHKLKMTIEWWPTKKWDKVDYSKITKIHIEHYDEYDCWNKESWLNIDFPNTEEWLKEAIRTANLTNMIVEDRKLKWSEAYPFAYGKYVSWNSALNFDIDTPGLWSNRQWWTCILSHDKLKERFPTVLDDLSKYPYVRWVFWVQEEMHDQAVHDKKEWSQYIKFLHQIGKWKFWKKVW